MKILEDAEGQETLERSIDNALLDGLDRIKESGTPEEYSIMVDNLEKLSNVKSATAKSRRGLNSVDGNTVVNVIGSLAGVAMVIVYEQRHVLATRAMQFIKRL